MQKCYLMRTLWCYHKHGLFSEQAEKRTYKSYKEHGAVKHYYTQAVEYKAEKVEPAQPEKYIVKHGRNKEYDRWYEHPQRISPADIHMHERENDYIYNYEQSEYCRKRKIIGKERYIQLFVPLHFGTDYFARKPLYEPHIALRPL